MTEEQKEAIRLHSAGAIVRHNSPFSHLVTPSNVVPMSQEVREKWVIPFYFNTSFCGWSRELSSFKAIAAEATPEMTRHLLGEFDWRPRMVGSDIAAVRGFQELQPEISHLFLKSEVCYAGSAYCYALASFGNAAAADTLSQYLEYYLTRPDLGFEQRQAMAALQYVDGLLGSNYLERHMEPWSKFVSYKSKWEPESNGLQFQKAMKSLNKLKESL